MCGIAGWVAFDSDLTRRRDILDAMTETLAYRGPDSRGTFVRTHAALGHRRLAIIDLVGGSQPMSVSTPGGDVGIVYGGEVYNFPELRKQLIRSGHDFHTESDTEVVLHGYLEWGEAVVDRLNGMYAFAIWDERDQHLVLIRDRIGVKPLFYYPTADGVLFGSEPKAILANPLAAKVVDEDGLRELFALTKAPGWALWKGMREVLPGELVAVDRSGLRARTYWRLRAAEHTDGREETIAAIRGLMTDIVDRQMISDVPRCVLLSGGLDSSALTGLAAAGLARDGEQLRTFSVDFVNHEGDFVPDGLRDTTDAPFVHEMARLVGSAHGDVVLDPADLTASQVRRAVVASRDIPAGLCDMDTSLYLLCKAIRKESTVALSGESADELFGGYRWFHDEDTVRSDTFPWLAFANPLTSKSRFAVLNPRLRARLEIDRFIEDQYRAAIAEVEHLDGESELEYRMRTACYLHLTRFTRMLLDRKDRASMAAGLEVRVPYCDHRLVEYVYNTPWALKTFDGREKSLLRHATKHVLPRSIVERVKCPYPTPQDPSFAAQLQEQAKQLLAEHDASLFEVVDRAWLLEAITIDPAQMAADVRASLERVIDLGTWIDLYSPELLV